ncbi:MAG: rod shape-determining protein MreD [Acidobacteriota bacterium]
MYNLGQNTTTPWQYFPKVVLYAFSLLLLQAVCFSRLPYPALRADLLLPLVFVTAIQWTPVPSVLWACFWGFIMDVFSGEFWGFHVGSYIFVTCMVNVASEKLEFQNPLYQMIFVGLCALGQSLALGFFFLLQPLSGVSAASLWLNLLLRSLWIMFLTPFVVFPIWNPKKGGSGS